MFLGKLVYIKYNYKLTSYILNFSKKPNWYESQMVCDKHVPYFILIDDDESER